MMSVAALWLTQGNSSSVYGPLFKQVNTGLQCWAWFRISASNEPAIREHVIIFGWGQREEAQTVTHLHACIHTLGKCLRFCPGLLPPGSVWHMLIQILLALSYRGDNWELIHVFGLTSVFTSRRILFMLGDNEDGRGAPPRGCILGAAWPGDWTQSRQSKGGFPNTRPQRDQSHANNLCCTHIY